MKLDPVVWLATAGMLVVVSVIVLIAYPFSTPFEVPGLILEGIYLMAVALIVSRHDDLAGKIAWLVAATFAASILVNVLSAVVDGKMSVHPYLIAAYSLFHILLAGAFLVANWLIAKPVSILLRR